MVFDPKSIDSFISIHFSSFKNFLQLFFFLLKDFFEGTRTMGTGVVKHEFFSSSKAYLSLHVGDEVKIIRNHGDGWSEGAIGSQRGLFPSNYVISSRLSTSKKPKSLNLNNFEEIQEDFNESEQILNSDSKELPVISVPSHHSQIESELDADSTDLEEEIASQIVFSSERNPFQNFVTVKQFILFFFLNYFFDLFF